MKHRDDILVGLVITVGLIILAIGSIYLVRGGLETGYPLYARFPWGSGIKQGQTVFLSGVEIGFVGGVDLKPDGTLIVIMRIKSNYHVPQGTTATIEPNGIFGDVDVALRPLHPNAASIPQGDTVPIGKPSVSLADLLARVDTASGHLSDVAKTVQVELVQGGGIADLRLTLENANKLVLQLSQIAADEGKQLSASTHSLNRALSAIDSTTVDSTIRNLKASSANLAALTSNLQHTTTRLDAILVKVDSGNGTAAKLINDPAVYNNLQALLGRLDSLTADLKKNPHRYVPNVHIF
jgi:phospholipid/cholesterol/gamma-HCH transport system substrate-binding protein